MAIYNSNNNINQNNTGSVVCERVIDPQFSLVEDSLFNNEAQSFEVPTLFRSSSYIEVFIDDSYKGFKSFNEVNFLDDSQGLVNEVLLDPPADLFNFNGGEAGLENDSTIESNAPSLNVIGYHFLDMRVGGPLQSLFISKISPDRTELELNSFILSYDDIVEQVTDFEIERNASLYFIEFLLNFSEGRYVVGVNIKLGDDVQNPKVLVKLREPLPAEYFINDPLWIVTQLDEPSFFSVEKTPPPIVINDTRPIQGPNFNLDVKDQVNNSTPPLSFLDLTTTQLTSSQNQIDSLLEEKGLKINIDYTDFNNFVHFSSARTRLENFFDKIVLIESHEASIKILNNTNSGSFISSSIGPFENQINSIISKFDQYEYFLYYNTGSHSWPKDTSTLPHVLAPTTSSKVIDWLGNGNINSPSYGGLLASPSDFDSSNRNQLLK